MEKKRNTKYIEFTTQPQTSTNSHMCVCICNSEMLFELNAASLALVNEGFSFCDMSFVSQCVTDSCQEIQRFFSLHLWNAFIALILKEYAINVAEMPLVYHTLIPHICTTLSSFTLHQITHHSTFLFFVSDRSHHCCISCIRV